MIRSRDGGFTLIEIVVSLGLATLVLVGTMGFMNAQSRSQRDSMELQTMQMGLRVGLERIMRDTRSASAGFNIGTISVQDQTVVTATGLVNLPAVYLGTNPALNQTNTGPGGSDVLNLVFADGRGITNTTKDANGVVTQSTTAQAINVLDVRNFVGTANYPDNFIIVSDVSNAGSAGSNAILAKVSAVANGTWPAGTLTIAPMSTANPFPVPNFPGGSLVLTASALTYTIDTSVFGTTEPALVMVRGGPLGITSYSDPLATQIEDLQVALGYDGLNAGTVDGFINENVAAGANLDEWAFNVAGDTLTGAIATLRAVRVSLVARSVTTRAIGLGPMTVEDHVPGTGANYLRRRLVGVASVRNLAF